jgi:hypothetical protein
MPWLLVVACASGILLGLWMRVPTVVAASAALVLSCAVAMPLTGWSAWAAIAYVFALLAALQCGYVVGVGLSLPSMNASTRPQPSADNAEVQRP